MPAGILREEIDKKINAAVVSLKQDFDETIDAVLVDNFELSQKIKALETGLEELIDLLTVEGVIHYEGKFFRRVTKSDKSIRPVIDCEIKTEEDVDKAAKKIMKRMIK